MTEPETEKARPSWGRAKVRISRWGLIGLVLGGGAIVAIVGLAGAAIVMGLLRDRAIEAVLAIGLILAAMAVTRLSLDLRRQLRVRARRRRMSGRDEGGEGEGEDEDEDA